MAKRATGKKASLEAAGEVVTLPEIRILNGDRPVDEIGPYALMPADVRDSGGGLLVLPAILLEAPDGVYGGWISGVRLSMDGRDFDAELTAPIAVSPGTRVEFAARTLLFRKGS